MTLGMTAGLFGLLPNQSSGAGPPDPPKSNSYLEIVQTFADTLLYVATDHYGPKSTSMWASVINAEDLSVPIRAVAPTTGVRRFCN